MKTLNSCPSVSSPFKEQQLAVPCGAAEALDELHATVSLQMLSCMRCYVPSDLQGLKVVKVWAAQLSQPPGRRAVALPGLCLQQEVLADGGQAREQLQQAQVPVVQVDPHGDSQAQTQVEVGAALQVQVILQLLCVFSDVQRDEGDAAGKRVGLLSPLNEDLIQVKAQELHFSSIRLCLAHRLLHQMPVKGDTQLLTFIEEKKERTAFTTNQYTLFNNVYSN